MTERRDSFWAQAGQVIWGICALIGGSALLVGAIKLLEVAWQPVGPVFWMIVGHALAWGMLLALGCIGIVIAAIPVFSTAKDWNTRARLDNALRFGGTVLALVVGLWIAVVAIEASIGLGDEPTRGSQGRHEHGEQFRTPWARQHPPSWSAPHPLWRDGGSGWRDGGSINPTPTKENGEPSYEFEPDDIERAEEAPPSVRAYCAGAVSEAQEVGCLSHVDPSEVP